jgi:hypothetical protein
MEAVETNYRPSHPEPSSTIPKVADTETLIRMLGTAVDGLHRRRRCCSL